VLSALKKSSQKYLGATTASNKKLAKEKVSRGLR
jgi:hypothetical protein